MVRTLRIAAFSLLLAGLLAGCATSKSYEALPDAVISTAPDAPGFVIVGLAEENAGSGIGHAALALVMSLRREDGEIVTMSRNGCGSMVGFYGGRPCDLTKLDWQVLKVSPGLWRPAGAAETTAIILGRKSVRAGLRSGPPVKVGAGEVVYIGDFVLAADYDTPSFVVRRHERDDAAAQRALATYAGLRNAPIVYRDPMAAAAP